MSQNLIFYDEESGTPLYRAEFPEGWEGQSRYSETAAGGQLIIRVTSIARDPSAGAQLVFKTGDTFSDGRNPDPYGIAKVHELCSAEAQLDELVSEYLGCRITAEQHLPLPEERAERVMQEGEKLIPMYFSTVQQLMSYSQVPMNVQLTGTIMDGAIGVYRFASSGKPMTLYSALWRIGYTTAVSIMNYGMSGMMGMPGMMRQMPQDILSTWTVPYTVNLLIPGIPLQQGLDLLVRFLRTLEESPQLRTRMDQLTKQNNEVTFHQALESMRANQSVIASAMAQQQAVWARSDALRQSLSQDLDRFRAGLSANSAAMDQFHSTLHSLNNAPSGFGSGSGSVSETMDDRIQRRRHESIMGINSYEREDGSVYEHTIMDDRVFEHQADQNLHIGTREDYSDFVPDPWHEMVRRK